MKNIIFVIIVICISSMNSQNIMSFDEVIDNNGFFKKNYYIKDTKNELDKFVGIWKGIFMGNSYEFRIEKILGNRTSSFNNTTLDRLFIRTLIKETNGNVLQNTLTTPLEDLYFKGWYFTSKNYDNYLLMYIEDMKCNLQGDVYFTIFENDTKIKVELFIPFNMVSTEECPDINKHSLLPQKRQNEYMILTKQ